MEAGQLVRTLVSGPIGGVVGVKYLADRIGIDNIVCSDIGGTSFDLALITGGEYALKNDPSIEHFKLNLPLLELNSVGAGTGSFVRLNPLSRRIEIGPDSAGSRIGVCYAEGGLETVSITDCNVVLGTINPDYFLGGELAIDRGRAMQAVQTQIAEPLGMSVERAASGVIELFEESLRQAVVTKVLGRGFEPVSYALCSYGGGGPLHVGGYTAGIPFRDVLVPAWAAGFSAFGCACADYEYRFERQIDLAIPPQSSAGERHELAQAINEAWDALANQVAAEFAKNGVPRAAIRLKPYVRLQYMGQLSDLEVLSPVPRIEEPGDFEKIIDAFEATYDRVYARSARSPELGYFVTRVVATGTVDCEKPALPNDALEGETPPASALKGRRQVFWRDRWIEARIYQMEAVRAGNVIEGLAVLESPATTFVVPPGRRARLDAHRIFHLG
jgi:N-methylhydantoinase A/oxoprolinase/acetone carboxylase beta subunit